MTIQESVARTPESISGGTAIRVTFLTARVQNILVGVLLLVYVVVGWLGRQPVQVGSGDDVVYLSLSRSIESWSYREIYRASAPLHVKYPPGYPAWLVIARHTTGGRLDVILAINLVLVALSFVLLFVVARRLAGGALALALLLLVALNPETLWMGGSLYSESLFLLLSVAALASTLAIDRSAIRSGFVAPALALLAFLTRSVGLAVVLAIGVWFWSRRRRSELAVYGVATAVVVGGWFGYVALASSGQPNQSYAGILNEGVGVERAGTILELVVRAWRVAVSYGTEVLPSALSLPSIPGTLVDDWFWLAANIVLIGTGIVVLWRTWRAAAAYLLLYAAPLLAWRWAIERLLAPVVPFILLALLVGAWHLARRLPVWARTPALATLVALLTVGAAQGAIGRVERYRQCDRASPYTSTGCFDPETRSMAMAADYIRTHLPAGEAVLSISPAGAQFLSGHVTEPAWLLEAVSDSGAALGLRRRKIAYVLLTALKKEERGPIARTLLKDCGAFRVEARFAPHAILLAVSTPGSVSGDACRALTAFVRENPEDSNPWQ